MESDPLVSVVTPSYNQAEFIGETIESVRKQSYDNVEHVVVDGESTDETLDILDRYDYLRYISEPDEGQSDAINKGFDMVSGEIIGWLNSDDVYFDRDVFGRVVRHFDRTGADVIYGDIALIDAESNILNFHCTPGFNYDKLRRYCFIEQPALFFRSNVLEDNRLNVELQYVMDYEFWLRLATEYDFRHVSDVLAADRNHPDRKILNDRESMKREARELQRQFGIEFDDSYRLKRFVGMMTSGLPRRLRAVRLGLQSENEELVFNGALPPMKELMKNTIKPNSTLV